MMWLILAALVMTGAVGATGEPGDAPATSLSGIVSGPEYDRLSAIGGEFDVEAKFWLMPGAEPKATRGIARRQMILGGLFMEERITGAAIGKLPYETLTLIGWDAGQKHYAVHRFTSTSPVQMPETARFDDAAQALNGTGEFRMVYMDIRQRSVFTLLSSDEQRLEIFLSFNGAPEFKGIEMRYLRRK